MENVSLDFHADFVLLLCLPWSVLKRVINSYSAWVFYEIKNRCYF